MKIDCREKWNKTTKQKKKQNESIQEREREREKCATVACTCVVIALQKRFERWRCRNLSLFLRFILFDN